jgi:carbonic anhydrase
MASEFLKGNIEFRHRVAVAEREFLRRLASEGQNPSALFVGCSDSRVVPELLTATTPGNLFVVRNVANLVPTFEHADSSVGAAIEYGVAVLRVKHVVVCGHVGCGGVHAVLKGRDGVRSFPSLYEWLETAEEPVGRVRGTGGDEGLAAVQENVVAQLENLLTYPVVADAVASGEVELHGWVYDLHTQAVSVWDADADAFVSAERLLAAT